MKLKKDGRTYNLSSLEIEPQELPQLPMMPPKRTWFPSGEVYTHVFGKGTTTKTPSLKELAHQQAEEDYPHIPKDDPIIDRRAKIIEDMMNKGV